MEGGRLDGVSKAWSIVEALATDIGDGSIALTRGEAPVVVGEIIRELRVIGINAKTGGMAHIDVHAGINGHGFARNVGAWTVEERVAGESNSAI